MTEFNFLSANGATNFLVTTDLIGLSAGSENCTVCQIDGVDNTVGGVLKNSIQKVKYGASELVKKASDNNLKLVATEIGKANTPVVKNAIALVAPASLTPTVISATEIDLVWVDNTNKDVNYTLEMATNSGFTVGKVTLYSGPLKAFNKTGLTTATPYYFRVRAIGTNATDGANATATATTS